MAGCILPELIFLHAPKTGGTWVRQVLVECGLNPRVLTAAEYPGHLTLFLLDRDFPECRGRFKFGFVRNPATWLQSWWRYRMTRGWHDNETDRMLGSPDFQKFIQNVLTHAPGFCTQHLTMFLGAYHQEINFIGKYENLVEDTITLLKRFYPEINESYIRAKPPFNVSDKKYRAEYTPELLEQIYLTEKELFDRFQYPLIMPPP